MDGRCPARSSWPSISGRDFDIDEKLLKAPENVKTILASVDTAFFCDVLHHIENRPAMTRSLPSAEAGRADRGDRFPYKFFEKRP